MMVWYYGDYTSERDLAEVEEAMEQPPLRLDVSADAVGPSGARGPQLLKAGIFECARLRASPLERRRGHRGCRMRKSLRTERGWRSARRLRAPQRFPERNVRRGWVSFTLFWTRDAAPD